mmetsp:Transcript_22844/g.52353  ORF Transcript_22844/g.52353 Transcript_22844/m.52353 type:complete len:92 (+) Transcript_22844:644-919(+)
MKKDHEIDLKKCEYVREKMKSKDKDLSSKNNSLCVSAINTERQQDNGGVHVVSVGKRPRKNAKRQATEEIELTWGKVVVRLEMQQAVLWIM